MAEDADNAILRHSFYVSSLMWLPLKTDSFIMLKRLAVGPNSCRNDLFVVVLTSRFFVPETLSLTLISLSTVKPKQVGNNLYWQKLLRASLTYLGQDQFEGWVSGQVLRCC